MFRVHSTHPETNAFDVNKIQQHIATINFLADNLLTSEPKHHLNSHLAVLRHAIQQFEKNRFADYLENSTERAEQVLHTRHIYKELYKHQLKKSDSAFLAKALKDELRDYATSVKGMVSEIQSDLTSSLHNTLDAAMDKQSWDMMYQDLKTIEREADAYYLAERLAEAQSPENDDNTSTDTDDQAAGYDYFGVMDMELSSEELTSKPYLRGSFDFDEETRPLLADQDSEDETIECPSSDTDEHAYESDSESYSSSSQRLFRLSFSSGSYSNRVSDSDETYDFSDESSAQSSPRSYR